MITYIKDNNPISIYDAENKYKNCNILMINPEKKENTTFGEVYAVSDSPDSHNELLDIENGMIKKGIKTIIGGEYSNSLSVDYLKMVKIA